MARLVNLTDSSASTATEFAQPTTKLGQLTIQGAQTVACQVAATVTTPTAKTFVDANVNVGSDTITITAHGYKTGLKVRLTTTGTLPGGLSTGVDYFAIIVDANTIKLASSLANAQAGTPVDITSASGGGTHTSTATALAACSAILRKSLDGTQWYDEGSSQTITATGDLYFEKVDPTAKYYAIDVTLTAGQVSVTTQWLTKGIAN